MNCWKTVNLWRDIGIYRIVILSTITMLSSFAAMYVILSSAFPHITQTASGLYLFLISLVLIGPIHKITHLLPAWLFRKKTKIRFQGKYRFFPVVETKLCEGISRNLFIYSILSPSVIITVPLIIASCIFPSHMHYFVILAVVNIGISITDFIYLYMFLQAPKKCIVESFDGGYDILIQNQYDV